MNKAELIKSKLREAGMMHELREIDDDGRFVFGKFYGNDRQTSNYFRLCDAMNGVDGVYVEKADKYNYIVER